MSTSFDDDQSQEALDPYVEHRGDQVYVRDNQVPLARIITLWNRSASPQAICDLCPPLTLAAIYGAIAYYLSHREAVDPLVAAYQREQQRHDDTPKRDRPNRPGLRSERGDADDVKLFEHFSERAREVMTLAYEEAQRFEHNYIGTEHLLLGLLRDEDGIAAGVLRGLDVDLRKVRAAVEFIIGRGDRAARVGEVGLTPRIKRVIELAGDEARRMKQATVGTEHLLLGMVREREGIGAGVLESLGVNLEKVRRAAITMSGGQEAVSPSKPAAPAASQALARSSGLDTDASGNFDEQARRALSNARDEAAQLNHTYIGTEHLMLALVGNPESTSMRALARLGVDAETVRETVLAIIDRGDRIVLGDIGLTPRAKRVVELAVDEARRQNSLYVGTEHLLLGAIRKGEGVAAGLLESLNVTYERAAEATGEVLREQGGGREE